MFFFPIKQIGLYSNYESFMVNIKMVREIAKRTYGIENEKIALISALLLQKEPLKIRKEDDLVIFENSDIKIVTYKKWVVRSIAQEIKSRLGIDAVYELEEEAKDVIEWLEQL